LHDPRTSADHRMIIMIGYGRPEVESWRSAR
jgi:hypothetical protein